MIKRIRQSTLLRLTFFALLTALASCSTKAPSSEEQGEKTLAEAKDKDPPREPADSGTANAPVAEKKEKPATSPPQGKQVILIVVDALRADALGVYGSKRPTSPAIDSLAAEGITFDAFHAASPWTGASFGSILTGTAPTVHGGGRKLFINSDKGEKIMGLRVTPLSEKVPTVAELLGDIPSAAVMTNSFLTPALGFGRGFDVYDHQNAGLSSSRRADETTKDALEWLDGIDTSKPFFMLVHYFDPHVSYDPPSKYIEEFASGPRGRIQAPFIEHSDARSGKLDPSDEEEAFIRGLYDGEVRSTDDNIGVLLEAFKKKGLMDTAWVMFTADHGEEIFDHQSFDHGHRYEEEVTRVPLIVRAPGGNWRAGARIPYSARHIDLAPTILAWFGREPSDAMHGKSLMPVLSGEEETHRPAYMEFNIYWVPREALFDGRYKIIHDVERDRGWVYDLEKDPRERDKLDMKHPEYARLKKQLMAVRRDLTARAEAVKSDAAPVSLDKGTMDSLKALGYIGE